MASSGDSQNKRRKKNKMKTYQEEISFKKSPQQAGPLRMRDVTTSCKVDGKKLVKEIKSVCKPAGADGVRTCSSSVDMKSMKHDDKNMARVIPRRITEIKFLPTKDMKMVVAGNEFGNVSFWKIDDESNDNNGIYVYYPHSGLVSGISIHRFSLSKIITSCYDGFIRMLDAEKESFDLVYRSISSHPVFSICRQYDNANSLFFGESYGGVGFLDLRSSKPSMPWNLHYMQIYTIDFNSHNTNLMATSSKDKTACIWDLRRMDQVNPKPLKLVQHKKAVNSAYFSPSGSLLATTSSDDKVGLISGTNYDVESMIYHSNNATRFISSFRGVWGWDDSSIMVANTKKGVDVLSIDEKKLAYTLGSSRLTAVPCRLDAHPMMPGVLAGSTAGGCVCVWDM